MQVKYAYEGWWIRWQRQVYLQTSFYALRLKSLRCAMRMSTRAMNVMTKRLIHRSLPVYHVMPPRGILTRYVGVAVSLEVYNVLDLMETLGEEAARRIASSFCCNRNLSVEAFVRNNAVDFAKQGISITYVNVMCAFDAASRVSCRWWSCSLFRVRRYPTLM